MYRVRAGTLQVLLAHPGGPFWARKDEGAWSLPNGEFGEGEEALAAACREFEEETGFTPQGPFAPLGEVRQRSGKRVQAWAFEGDCDCAQLRSNTFEMEWPPRSGRRASFPEVDRAAYFGAAEALTRIHRGQRPLIEDALKRLARSG
jgi:predicted NUDIX family NTP pyrophosphohydrolase